MALKKKGAAKVAPKLTRYSKGEHIKVAPLHSPKPTMSIDELSNARQEQSDTDLFDGQTPAAPAPAHLAYFGGPLPVLGSIIRGAEGRPHV
jgi:hypothetical protein